MYLSDSILLTGIGCFQFYCFIFFLTDIKYRFIGNVAKISFLFKDLLIEKYFDSRVACKITDLTDSLRRRSQ